MRFMQQRHYNPGYLVAIFDNLTVVFLREFPHF